MNIILLFLLVVGFIVAIWCYWEIFINGKIMEDEIGLPWRKKK